MEKKYKIYRENKEPLMLWVDMELKKEYKKLLFLRDMNMSKRILDFILTDIEVLRNDGGEIV